MTSGFGGLGLLGSALLTLSESEKKIIAWNNVPPVAGAAYKIDCDLRYIVWEEYGKYTEYGWQIDHIVPEVFGGLSLSTNLRARHWRGNSQAGGYAGALSKRLRSY